MSTFRSRDIGNERYTCECGASYHDHNTIRTPDGAPITFDIDEDGADIGERCPGNGHDIEPTPGIDGTLTERHSKYGSYVDQCSITQDLKTIMHCSTNWAVLPADMKESLDMIASKISRILNGDPSYVDSWHDISGYARLIEKRLQEGDTKSE